MPPGSPRTPFVRGLPFFQFPLTTLSPNGYHGDMQIPQKGGMPMQSMLSRKKAALAATLRDARAYLDYLTEDAAHEPDFRRLHSYLTALTPCLSEPRVSIDLVRTVARLYFETERYQEALVLLKRFKDPGFHNMQVHCDFHSGYFATLRDWAARQDMIWDAIDGLMPALADEDETEEEANDALREALDHLFPTDQLHFTYLDEEEDGAQGLLLPGNPDGIYSLFPMTYLLQHVPEDIAADWNVALDAEEVDDGSVSIEDIEMPLGDIAVRITPSPAFHVVPRVDLTLWHPGLHTVMPMDSGKIGKTVLQDLMRMALPTAAANLYVDKITVAERPFGPREETTPLLSLSRWFLDHGMDPDVPVTQILHHRVYAFTRTPVAVSRPRADIVRGETCMPELEEICFLRDGKGMAALQRYGVGYWFLIVPNAVCGGNFPAFRDRLIQAVRREEGDTVCFTGWAEGTRNCYIDFLSLDNYSVLPTLHRYCEDLPGGEGIRISTFYWNAVPRTMDIAQELQQQAALGRQMEAGPGPADPPKEQVSQGDRARLEQAFRDTRWERREGGPDWDLYSSSSYGEAVAKLDEGLKHIVSCDVAGTPYDFVLLSGIAEAALPEGDAPGAPDVLSDRMSSVLLTLERYRESVKWSARIRSSELRTTRLYTCAVGSDYPSGSNQWEPRRQAFWKWFTRGESGMALALNGAGNPAVFAGFQEQLSAVFPCDESLLLRAGEDRKCVLLTGLPGGIVTLPALLYFTSHYPASIGRRWHIDVSWEVAPLDIALIQGQAVRTQDIQVSLRGQGGTVSLSLWHPLLLEAAQANARNARGKAAQLVNVALPMGARLLYVEAIRIATEAPEDAFPLPALQQQMQERGYRTDIPLDTLLARRKYTIARHGKYNGRPRSDILRGETCMPELERIYNRVYEEGQTILERHGLAALFLMIPNRLCQGDPAQYRQQLQRYLTLAEGDKVFFTGWAEGTEYCYLDLISMHGRALLGTLNEYALGNPGGRELRFSTFFWNSTPRSWVIEDVQGDLVSERPEDFVRFAKDHAVPDFPVPDAAAIAALEASFQPAFTPEDLCAPKPAEAPAPAPQRPAVGKKKLSKAQRKAQNAKDNNKKKH